MILEPTDLVKLEPTDLYLTIDTEKLEGYQYIGSYLEYEFDTDIKPYIMQPIKKEVSVLNMEPQLCTHFYDYVDKKYSFMYHDGHSFQSLMKANDIEFDEDEIYSIFIKV